LRFDEEVFAVLLALAVVGSVFSIAVMFRPSVTEPFTALGLLDENCMIGHYPKTIVAGENVTLCIYVFNYNGTPIHYKVVFKLGDRNTIPTNTTPLNMTPIESWEGVLSHNESTTFKVRVNINSTGINRALIFELWLQNPITGEWFYSGRWVHLYVNVTEAPLP
jgi:uncharacterized membrane protein